MSTSVPISTRLPKSHSRGDLQYVTLFDPPPSVLDRDFDHSRPYSLIAWSGKLMESGKTFRTLKCVGLWWLGALNCESSYTSGAAWLLCVLSPMIRRIGGRFSVSWHELKFSVGPYCWQQSFDISTYLGSRITTERFQLWGVDFCFLFLSLQGPFSESNPEQA